MSWILLACVALFPATALSCHAFAAWMRRRSLGQQIRSAGPRSHAVKAGTPTLGGTVFLVLWGVTVGLLSLTGAWPGQAGFVLASGLAFGALGLADDVLSLRRRQSLGLTGVQKILLGSLIAIGLFLLFQEQILVPQHVPFTRLVLLLPWGAAALLSWILFLASTNAANLTDGLDGLAGSVSAVLLAGLLMLLPDRSNAFIILPLLAALAGFLWMNTHPAGLIMGDVGAFGLGGIIGALALANGAAFLLPILAGVFVLEALSVLLQVGALKTVGKRFFKMSPLHHHFEAFPNQGSAHWLPAFEWPEGKVVSRFVLAQVGFVLLAWWAVQAWT